MVCHNGFINGAGVIIQPAGNGEIDGKVLFRNSELFQMCRHCNQLIQPLVKHSIHTAIPCKGGKHLVVGAGDRHKVHHIFGFAWKHLHFVYQQEAYFFRPDFIELVDSTHDLPCLFRHPVHTVEPIENLAIIHMDFKAPKP